MMFFGCAKLADGTVYIRKHNIINNNLHAYCGAKISRPNSCIDREIKMSTMG